METHSDVRVTIDSENPYGDLIRGFLMGQFPAAIQADKKAKLDLLTMAVMGNGMVRFGPTPEPESLVVVRAVIRDTIERNVPIPILVPWGSKKPDNSSLDIAEVGALKQLACLQRRVLQHHAPGVQIRLRIEDASGYYLYAGESGADQGIDQYTKDLCALIGILDLSFIQPVPESGLFTALLFATKTDEVAVVMEAYLKATEKGFGSADAIATWLKLNAMTGIKGDIEPAQREYYYRLYRSLFPGIDQEAATTKLARYLSGALVRTKIGGRGEDTNWRGKHIQITFAPPVPGSPASLVQHFLYYRALPSRMAHTPPWRAKGYLEMRGREVTSKIANWGGQPKDLVPCAVQLVNKTEMVSISADYRIMD